MLHPHIIVRRDWYKTINHIQWRGGRKVHSSNAMASGRAKFVPTTALELPATNPASGVMAVRS